MKRLIRPLLVVIVLSSLPILPSQADAQGATCRGQQVTIDMNITGSGNGTPGNDVILGTAGADSINGLAGDDTICAGGGSDTVDGGPGRDFIYGGTGADTIHGGSEIDRIWGDSGNDEIHGDGGSDRIRAGAGDDTVFAGSGADRVWGGPGNDTLNGMGGQDHMWGEGGHDVMQGNHQSDWLYGGPGNDEVYGAGGKDKLFGDAGNDQLVGGDNTDFLFGGPGADVANGGKGQDHPLVENMSGCVAETRISCNNNGQPVTGPTPTAVPPTPPPDGRFTTLPVGAALPAGEECAALVRPAAEIRSENAAANANRGSRANANNRTDWAGFDRVDGDFAGTTDEIIQWTACKWGIDEDIVRAQVVTESYWRQSTIGDNGESWGLGQVRDTYHQSAFEFSVNARNSSAYNLDYTYASWRACFEGVYDWLNHTNERTGVYEAGDAWGCLGVWYSGRWYFNTDRYLNQPGGVRFHYENHTWANQAFINAG